MSLTFIKGAYFASCQFCTHDGSCELRHNEFTGLSPAPGVDTKTCLGQEDFAWHFVSFQKDTPRAHCSGRIGVTGSENLPLCCECGTAIDDISCQRFVPNDFGKKRIMEAMRLAVKRGVGLNEIRCADLSSPGPYQAVMQ